MFRSGQRLEDAAGPTVHFDLIGLDEPEAGWIFSSINGPISKW